MSEKISRRNFLKGLGAIGGAAVGGAAFLLGPKSDSDEQPDNVELRDKVEDFPSVEELKAAGFTVAMSSSVVL